MADEQDRADRDASPSTEANAALLVGLVIAMLLLLYAYQHVLR
jgi:hypothetical protein